MLDVHLQPSSVGTRTQNRNFQRMYDYDWSDPDSGKEEKTNPFYMEKHINTSEASISTMASRPRGFGLVGSMYGAAPHDTKLMDGSEDEGDDDLYVYPGVWKRAALLVCALVPYMVASLDDTIIATLIPVLINRFERPQDIGWYASAEYLPYAILMPSLGKAYKLWQIKWIFLSSILIFAIGSMACATAQTSFYFILGRGITGSGGAGILQGTMRINQIAFPQRQRLYVEAVGVAIMGACIMAGPLVGGVIADHLGWEWAFWINVPTSAVSFIGTLFLFPRDTPQSPLNRLPGFEKFIRLDPVGSALLIASICCLLTVLQDYSASTTFVLVQTDILLVVISGVLFVLFLMQEIFVRPDLALIPRAIARRRAVWSNCVVLFFLFMSFTNVVFFLSIFFQVVQGDSSGQSAIALLPYVVSATIASGTIAFCVPRARYYNPFFLAGGVMFSVGMGLISRIDQNINSLHLAGLQAVFGIGVGILVLANVAPCHTTLPEKDHAVANGLAFFSASLGSTLSIPASSALFNQQIIEGFKTLEIPPELKFQCLNDIASIRSILPPENLDVALAVVVHAINATFLIGLVCSIVSVIFVLFIPWQPVTKGEEEKDRGREGKRLPL